MAQNNGPYSPPPNSEKPPPEQQGNAAQQTPQATGNPYTPPNYPPQNVEKPTQAHYNPCASRCSLTPSRVNTSTVILDPGQQHQQQYQQQYNQQGQSYYGPPQDQYWSGQQYSYQHTQYRNEPQQGQPQPQIVYVQAPPREDDCLPYA
ncbi:hypothetical protein CVT26_003516, partial [Gymnopilus dilepis]